jgi:hypothetical protein
MINWDEVKNIEADHIEDSEYYVCRKIFKIDSERAHEQRGDLLELIAQFRPHPFDPDDRMTWPEMETEVLVRFDFGWKIAKLCYTAITKGPIWKTDKERWDYTAGIEWQPLPPVGKEEIR